MALFDLLPALGKKDTRSNEENYLSLTITSEKILATIWAFDDQKVNVLATSRHKYQNRENLIRQAAQAIDSAAEEAKTDVSQVVFGLSANWFTRGQISQDTTRLLEDMATDLELKAQAFVPLSVAVKNFLKTEEKIPPHVVAIGIFENSLEVHLINNNQLIESHQSADKPTLEKIKELIGTISQRESLPSRIVVFGSKEDAHIATELTKADFKNLFSQEPKIDFISEDQLATAVSYAQAADILGHELDSITKTPAAFQKEPANQADDLGFVEGEDILTREEKPENEEEFESKEELEPEADSTPDSSKTVLSKEETAVKSELQADEKLPREEAPRHKKAGLLETIMTLGYLDKITSVFKGQGNPKKISIVALIILAVLFIGNLIAGFTIAKAEVVIKVKSEPQEENFSAGVVKDGSNDFENGQIAGSEITGQTSGSQKAVTTGKKKLGNYAKGEITVLNWTTGKTSLASGTTVISKNGVKFNLDSAVEVASRSASTPGESKANVTAVDFGANGNLSANSNFSFQQYDELLYSARNESAFSGGDEKEITVVSKEDMDKLQTTLFSTLKDKAIADLKSSNPDQAINDDAIVVEATNKQFDKKLDEEATLVNLDMEVVAKTISYAKEDLASLLTTNANENAPDGLEAKPENIEILQINTKPSKDKLNLAGKFRANFIPKLNEDELKSKIAGKGEKQMRQIILEIAQVADVTLDFSPPFLVNPRIPSAPEKVTFKIETI